MTNKEAIRRILDHQRVHSLNEPRAVLINEALDLAIKALEQTEVKGDLISREALKNIMKCNLRSWGAQGVLVDEVMKTIDNAQTVDIKDQIAGAYNEGYKCGRREADRWIPVSERLPDKEDRCLVFTDYGDVTMDSFVAGMFVCYLGNVTHWKPLPPKPCESEDSK